MAVQAEMGDSASDAAIKQVEVEATAPISDVRFYCPVSIRLRNFDGGGGGGQMGLFLAKSFKFQKFKFIKTNRGPN